MPGGAYDVVMSLMSADGNQHPGLEQNVNMASRGDAVVAGSGAVGVESVFAIPKVKATRSLSTLTGTRASGPCLTPVFVKILYVWIVCTLSWLAFLLIFQQASQL